MRKRILSLTVAVLMLITTLSFATEKEQASETAKYDTQIAFLEAVGVIDRTRMPEFDENTVATRAVAAFMVTRMLYQDETEVPQSGTGFTDIDLEHWAASEIYMGKNHGLLNGTGDNQYSPDNEITLAQALKLTLNAIGYGKYAEVKGGYPTGYMVTASKLKLLPKASENDAITIGQLAYIIDKALNAPMFLQTSFGTSTEYNTDENVTVLSEYHDIYKNKGIVTDNGVSMLTDVSKITKDEITIKLSTGKTYTYNKNNIEVDDLLGYQVEYYFHDDNSGTKNLIYITPIKTSTLTISSQDIVSFDSNGYTYLNADGNKEKASIVNTPDIIYNNVAYMPSSNQEMIPTDGRIVLIDQNNDSNYDVVRIYDFDTYCIDRIYETSELYMLKDAYGKAVTFDQNSVSLKVLKDGKQMDFDDIEKWHIASIAVSKNSNPKTYVTIYVSDRYVDGNLTEIADSYWMVDGNEYDLAPSIKNNQEIYTKVLDLVTIGKNYSFRLNTDGKIAGVEEDILSADTYVLLIATDYTGKGLKNEVNFQVLNTKSDLEILKSNESLTVNGKPYKGIDNYMRAITGGTNEISPQIAMISRTSEGRLKSIDIVAGHLQSNNLIAQYVDEKVTYKKTNRIFSGYFSVNEMSSIFFINSEGTSNIEKYTAFTPDDVGDTTYSASAYNVADNGIAKAVILRGEPSSESINNDDFISVVHNITTTIDKNDESRTKVYFYQKGILNSYLISKSYDKKLTGLNRLNPGDAFRYYLDPVTKEISTITKHLHYATKDTWISEASALLGVQTDYNYLLRFVRGTVIDKTGTTIKVRVNRASVPNGYVDLFFSMHRSNIMVYSETTGKITAGTIKDVLDAQTVGDGKASMVFMRQRYGEVLDTIVYNP